MKTETNPLSVLDPLVTITELAEYLGVLVKTTMGARPAGAGLLMVKLIESLSAGVRAAGRDRQARPHQSK